MSKQEPIGQILPWTEFGKQLTRLAREAATIVEIGTWRGGGSTRCFSLGLIRPEQRLYCVDQSQAMLDEARVRNPDFRITFIHGSLHPIPEAPVILDQLPPKIDLILIDGGAECGRADFDAIHDRCKIVALDDVTQVKNNVNFRKLRDEWKWNVIEINLTERLGYAIFERPTV